jgi:hypothetical protein
MCLSCIIGSFVLTDISDLFLQTNLWISSDKSRRKPCKLELCKITSQLHVVRVLVRIHPIERRQTRHWLHNAECSNKRNLFALFRINSANVKQNAPWHSFSLLGCPLFLSQNPWPSWTIYATKEGDLAAHAHQQVGRWSCQIHCHGPDLAAPVQMV